MSLSSNFSRSLLVAFTATALFVLNAAAVPIVLDYETSGVGAFQKASKVNSDDDVELGVNKLITWHNGGVPATWPEPDVTFYLAANSLAPLPTPALYVGREGDDFSAIDSSLYTYVLGKYANSAYVFYLGDLAPGLYILPEQMPDLVKPDKLHDLSHQAWFSTPGVKLPDGSTTVSLVGLGLLGTALFRRRFSRS